MAKREKSSRTYQDSSDDDVEILGSAQVSGAPEILHSTALSRIAKKVAAASSARSHRYNYRDNSDAEDVNDHFVASPLSENNDKDLSEAEVVGKSNPKSQRRRIVTARVRVSATPASSAKRTSVKSANKNQS